MSAPRFEATRANHQIPQGYNPVNVSAVNEARQAEGSGTTAADLDRWLDALAALRDDDPARFEAVANRLKAFVERNPSTPPVESEKTSRKQPAGGGGRSG